MKEISKGWGIGETAAALHADAFVLDLTCPWLDYPGSPIDLRFGTLSRMKDSGYTYVSLTIALDDQNVERVITSIARERRYFLSHPENFILVESVDDIRRAKEESKLAIGFHFQGTEAVQRDLNMVALYYRLGIRHMLIAYNQKNSAGDGCHETTDGGLSRYGRSLVEEMNRVGMLIDVSHTGYRTTMDVIEASSAPVVFSHSNPKALVNHPRNITDDQIRACVEKGGMIGVNGCGVFLGNNDISTETFLRNIDHHVQIAGANRVGLGIDYVYDQESWHPYILRTSVGTYIKEGAYLPDQVIKYVAPEQIPGVTEGLLKMGYSETDIRGILGENWLDIMQRVWKRPNGKNNGD